MKPVFASLLAVAAALSVGAAHARTTNLLPSGSTGFLAADASLSLAVGKDLGAGTLDLVVGEKAGAAASVFAVYEGSTEVFSESLPAGGGKTTIDLPLADLTAGPLVFVDTTSAKRGLAADGWSLDDAKFVAAPVPEPQTGAMLLVGLAAIGFVVSRRARA